MTTHRPPEYRLQHVLADGRSTTPQAWRLDAYDPTKRFGRRDFLKTSALPLAPLLAGGCGGGGGGGAAADPDAVNAAFRAGVTAHYGLRKAKFSPDGGRLIASLGDDAQVKLWHADNRLAATFTTITETRDFAFSPDGTRIAVATSYNVAVYDTRSYALLRVFDVIDINPSRALASIRDVALTAAGQVVVNTATAGVHHWDLATGTYRGGFATLGGDVSFFMRPRPQGDALLVGGGSGTFELRAFPSGALLGTFSTGAFTVDPGFSPDGNTFVAASASGPNRAMLWDFATRTLRRQVSGSFAAGDIHSFLRLTFTPDGRLLGVANRNDNAGNWVPTAVLIDVASGAVTLADGLVGVDEVSPDGTRYLSDGQHNMWIGGDCSTNNPRLQLLAGRVDLAAAAPRVLDGTPLYAQDATDTGRQTRLHSAQNAAGQTIYVASDPTLELPAGAACTCNSVGGTGARAAKSCGSGGGGGSCTCNTVCICVPVFF